MVTNSPKTGIRSCLVSNGPRFVQKSENMIPVKKKKKLQSHACGP